MASCSRSYSLSDENRPFGRPKQVVCDRSEDEAPQITHAARADDDDVSLPIRGNVTDHFCDWAGVRDHRLGNDSTLLQQRGRLLDRPVDFVVGFDVGETLTADDHLRDVHDENLGSRRGSSRSRMA